MVPSPIVNEDGVCNVDRLQDILRAKMTLQVDLSNVKTEPATAKGNNFLSDVWRVKFDHKIVEDEEQEVEEIHCVYLPYYKYITNNVPHASCYVESIGKSVIVKSKPKNDALNALMHTDIAFVNEDFAYEKMIHALGLFSRGPLRMPLYIYGNTKCIVLEDLNTRSFYNADKKIISDWNRVWSPLQEIAKLHASSLLLKTCEKKIFDGLVKEMKQVPFEKTLELGKMQATTIDTTLKVIEQHAADTKINKKALESLKEGAWKEQRKIIDQHVPIRTINHGSIWINNLLYRNNMAAILDWQHIVYSSPAIDLSFFLYVNLDADFLTDQRKKLLEFYLLNLHQNIYEVCDKSDLKNVDEILKPLTYAWIDQEFKRCSLYGYMMSMWIQPVLFMSEAVFAMVEKAGGVEKLPVEKRLEHMTSEEKDRIIKLTKFFLNEYNV